MTVATAAAPAHRRPPTGLLHRRLNPGEVPECDGCAYNASEHVWTTDRLLDDLAARGVAWAPIEAQFREAIAAALVAAAPAHVDDADRHDAGRAAPFAHWRFDFLLDDGSGGGGAGADTDGPRAWLLEAEIVPSAGTIGGVDECIKTAVFRDLLELVGWGPTDAAEARAVDAHFAALCGRQVPGSWSARLCNAQRRAPGPPLSPPLGTSAASVQAALDRAADPLAADTAAVAAAAVYAARHARSRGGGYEPLLPPPSGRDEGVSRFDGSPWEDAGAERYLDVAARFARRYATRADAAVDRWRAARRGDPPAPVECATEACFAAAIATGDAPAVLRGGGGGARGGPWDPLALATAWPGLADAHVSPLVYDSAVNRAQPISVANAMRFDDFVGFVSDPSRIAPGSLPSATSSLYLLLTTRPGTGGGATSPNAEHVRSQPALSGLFGGLPFAESPWRPSHEEAWTSLRLGAAYTYPTHIDCFENVILQLHGRKTVTLFSPAAVGHFRPDLAGKHWPRTSRREQAKAEPVRRTVVLDPGDQLYVPIGFLHSVRADEWSVTANRYFELKDEGRWRARLEAFKPERWRAYEEEEGERVC